jgi:hypothetical protein
MLTCFLEGLLACLLELACLLACLLAVSSERYHWLPSNQQPLLDATSKIYAPSACSKMTTSTRLILIIC